MEILSAKNKVNSYIIQSQEDELKRIALELHEGVGQTLYSLNTGLKFIEMGIDKPEIKNYINEMQHLLEKTIQEIQFLSVELHPPTLTTLGLYPAMQSYLKLFTHTYGILVEVQNRGEEQEVQEIDSMTLFRVCQEALVNIAKYADTCKVEVTFVWEQENLNIEVRDFGKGFVVEHGMNQSTGLAAMKERMSLVGGNCEITSVIGEGTCVNITLPLK